MRRSIKKKLAFGLIGIILLAVVLVLSFRILNHNRNLRRVIESNSRLRITKIGTSALSGFSTNGDWIEAEFTEQEILKGHAALFIGLALDEDQLGMSGKVCLKSDVQVQREECQVGAEISQWRRNGLFSVALPEPISQENCSHLNAPISDTPVKQLDLDCKVKLAPSDIHVMIAFEGLEVGDKIGFKSVEISMK